VLLPRLGEHLLERSPESEHPFGHGNFVATTSPRRFRSGSTPAQLVFDRWKRFLPCSLTPITVGNRIQQLLSHLPI